MDKKLLSLLVCPITKGSLQYDNENKELIATSSGLAYAIRDEIPVMLESEARELSSQEKERWAKKTP